MNLIKEDVVQLNSYIFFINMLLVSKTGALETGLRGNPVQIGNGPATVISRSSLYMEQRERFNNHCRTHCRVSGGKVNRLGISQETCPF